ncbi:MAG TPA: hypothetical protein VHC22_16240 [Pirellulales bacterium]|nr:hypothetical protein [Pirellulales bacterium]
MDRSFGGEFDAMFREMVKDIRQTANEVFFNHHEHAPEMGTPMNNTPQMTYDDLKQQAAEMVPAQQNEIGLER